MDPSDFRNFLIRHNFRIIETKPDGNCFYAALAYAVKNDMLADCVVRQEICNFIDVNRGSFAQFLDRPYALTVKNFEVLKRTVDGRGVDQLSFAAASMLYRRNIAVLNPLGCIVWYPLLPEQRFTNTIYLAWVNFHHFCLLESIYKVSGSKTEASIYCTGDDILEHTIWHGHAPVPIPAICPNAFDSGHLKCVTIVLLISRAEGTKENPGTLMDALKMTKEREIWFNLVYSHALVEAVKSDTVLRKRFWMFMRPRPVELNLLVPEMMTLMTNFVATPTILATLRFSWGNFKLKQLVHQSTNPMPMLLLSKDWEKVQGEVEQDVRDILDSPRNFMCAGCARTCKFRGKVWHLDMEDFQPLRLHENATTTGYWHEYKSMEQNSTSLFALPSNLERICQPYAIGKVSRLFSSLDSYVHHSNKRRDVCTTYMMLVLDGPCMAEYSHDCVNALLQRSDVCKSLYIGYHYGNDPFPVPTIVRAEVLEIMTWTSKLYYVRKRRLPFWRDAQKDVALTFEIVKTYLNRIEERGMERPFLLLNCPSPDATWLSESDIRYVHQYCDSGVPLINIDPTNISQHFHGSFSGNFVVEEKISLKPGNLEGLKSFDEVRATYAIIRSQQPH